jgi:glutamate/tyrosine decarboxylase-like PLP-dependent enzyme
MSNANLLLTPVSFLSLLKQLDVCTYLTVLILDYQCLSQIHKPRAGKEAVRRIDDEDPEGYEPGLPVVSFRLADQFVKDYPHLQQAAVSTLLRVKGWILPNYPLPPTCEATEILRVVVRESFSSSNNFFCNFANISYG